jgi:uncharacterized membrane protein
MTKGRLEAFSDGIIAIIITITILLIDLPQGNEWPDLLTIMPLVICYLISFILVGTHWVNHHHLLQVAGEVNGKILWANLLYLFVLSFIPVTTGWVGKSYFSMIPVRVYIIVNMASAVGYVLLEQAIIHSSDNDLIRMAVAESRKELWTFFVEALALAASFIPEVHYAACPLLVVAVLPWIIPDLRMKRVFDEIQRQKQSEEDDSTM